MKNLLFILIVFSLNATNLTDLAKANSIYTDVVNMKAGKLSGRCSFLLKERISFEDNFKLLVVFNKEVNISSKWYKEGDIIAGDCVVYKIFNNRVVIKNNSITETLFLNSVVNNDVLVIN